MNEESIITICRSRLDEKILTESGCRIQDSDIDVVSNLTKIDIKKIELIPTTDKKDDTIDGYDTRRSLKEKGFILLDVDVMLSIFEKTHLIPENWKKAVGRSALTFYGTVFSKGYHSTSPYLFLGSDDSWKFGARCLNHNYTYDGELAAVLTEKPEAVFFENDASKEVVSPRSIKIRSEYATQLSKTWCSSDIY